MSTPEGVPTMACQVCETDVPAGEFCGYCGTPHAEKRGGGPAWLRLKAFGAAPGEYVLLPWVTSSLFPHLHRRSRAPFRVALAILLIALIVCAVLRWQAPLVAVSALGLPLLFHLYSRESDAYEDLPRWGLPVVSVLAIGVGVGWASLTARVIARSYDVAFRSGMEFKQPLWEGLVIPVGGALVMLTPTVLARLARVGFGGREEQNNGGESLDGFLIGAIAAMSFTAAATLTRLAPQFATGLVASNRPIGALVAEACIRGVAVSLTAAAAGGMVGAALWFTKPDPAHQHRGQWLAGPLPALVVVLTAYAVVGLVDASPAPETWQLVVHLVVALLLVLALRLVLHMALLREAHDPITQEPLLCTHCGQVVPDMAFCPACGVATRASSRSSRTARRADRPQRVEAPPGDS